MAAIWETVVCRVHDTDNRKLFKGWNQYVPRPESPTELVLTWAGFVAFDQYKSMLADSEGKLSGPRTVLAGFGAGATESLLAVTPFESIKTTLYSVHHIAAVSPGLRRC